MQKIRDKNSLALQNHSLVFTMAEEIISLGCGDDSEIAFFPLGFLVSFIELRLRFLL